MNPAAQRMARDRFGEKLGQMQAKFFAGANSDRTGVWSAEDTGARALAERRWEYANREYQKAKRAQLQRKLDALRQSQPNQEI